MREPKLLKGQLSFGSVRVWAREGNLSLGREIPEPLFHIYGATSQIDPLTGGKFLLGLLPWPLAGHRFGIRGKTKTPSNQIKGGFVSAGTSV